MSVIDSRSTLITLGIHIKLTQEDRIYVIKKRPVEKKEVSSSEFLICVTELHARFGKWVNG